MIVRYVRAFALAVLLLACSGSEMADSGAPEPTAAAAMRPRAYLPLVSQSPPLPIPADCFRWTDQVPLQDAIDQHACVVLQPGLWTTRRQITLPAGHSLLGSGMSVSILQAAAPWIGNGVDNLSEAVIHNNGQPGVVVKYLTVDANYLASDGIGASGRDTTITAVTVRHARCDGIAIAAAGWTVQDSIIQGNGAQCHTGVPGSGIYVKRQEYDVGDYSPQILNNNLHDNSGPAIDIDQVQGGLISGNTLRANAAWAAISLNASHWTIVDNDISHPLSADPVHPNHPECAVKYANSLAAGISVCRQPGADAALLVQYNTISGNRIAAGHGVRLMGADEADPTWIPRFNTIYGNDLSGSLVGCLDDFEPGLGLVGANVWADNSCASQPVYLWRLCPNSVSSATVAGWQLGVAQPSAVQAQIDAFNAYRLDGGAFAPGDWLPAGALVATSFDPAGTGSITWASYPVATVVRSGSWGLFRVTSAFAAPTPGACLLVFP